MSNPLPSPDAQTPRRLIDHWAALRRHWLFSLFVLLLSPLVGLWLAGDRGVMFGLAVGVLSCFWIWWEGQPAPNDAHDGESLK